MITAIAAIMVTVGAALGVKWYMDRRDLKAEPKPPPGGAAMPDEDVTVEPFAPPVIDAAPATQAVDRVIRPPAGQHPDTELIAVPGADAASFVADQKALESTDRTRIEAAGQAAGVIPAETKVAAAEVARSPDMVEVEPKSDKKIGAFLPDAVVQLLPSLRTLEEGAVDLRVDAPRDERVGAQALAGGIVQAVPEPEPVREALPGIEDPTLEAQLNVR